MFAFRKIELLYLSIQIGLKPESHARVSELTDYILSVNYSAMASNPTYALVQTPLLPTWNSAALLEFTPQFAGTVSRTPEEPTSTKSPTPSNEDFIGPRLPEIPGTVAI
jgi:hypothetical protein